MKWFFHQWWLSISDLNFYRHLPMWSPKRTLMFLVVSSLLLGQIATARWIWRELPLWQQDLETSRSLLMQHYPPDLVITWDLQRLQVNKPDTTVPFAPQTRTTTFPFTTLARWQPEPVTLPTDKLASDTYLYFTPTQLLVSDWAAGWLEVPLSTTPGFEAPFTITQATIPQIATQVSSFLAQVLNLSPIVFGFINPIVIFVGICWQSMINTLLLVLVLRLFGVHGRWLKLWQLSIHILLVAELVHQSAWLLYGVPSFWLPTLIYWLLIGFWWLGQVGYPYPLGEKQ